MVILGITCKKPTPPVQIIKEDPIPEFEVFMEISRFDDSHTYPSASGISGYFYADGYEENGKYYAQTADTSALLEPGNRFAIMNADLWFRGEIAYHSSPKKGPENFTFNDPTIYFNVNDIPPHKARLPFTLESKDVHLKITAQDYDNYKTQGNYCIWDFEIPESASKNLTLGDSVVIKAVKNPVLSAHNRTEYGNLKLIRIK